MAFSEYPGQASPNAFQIHGNDNVATLLDRAEPGPVFVHGACGEDVVMAREMIEAGHKIALAHIGAGQEVVKYGVVIGVASLTIYPGAWVHLHNCKSRMDERSGTFDVRTGLPEDTKYE